MQLFPVSGGMLSDRRVVFSRDNRYFFCCVKNAIKKYTVGTGQLVMSFEEAEEHTDQVMSLAASYENDSQIYSCSLDGTMKLWETNQGCHLKTIKFGFPLTHIATHPKDISTVYAVTSKQSVQKYHYNPRKGLGVPQLNDVSTVYKYDHSTGKVFRVSKMKQCIDFAISADGHYFAAVSKNVLHIWRNMEGFPRRKFSTKPLSQCLAFHPTEESIAVGDAKGIITIYYCLGDNVDNTPATSSLHWHADGVNSLTFTIDGAYLLSGGNEGVLVLWNLQKNDRRFLPGMGAEIAHISVSPNEEIFALCLRNNSVKLISGVNLELENVVQGIQREMLPDAYRADVPTGLVYNPRLHSIAMNGNVGSVQFYDLDADRLALELQVTPHTFINQRKDKQALMPEVSHAGFNANGSWFVTVDVRSSADFFESYLKFWHFDEQKQVYRLNSRIDDPHSESVTAIDFNHSTRVDKMYLVTCGKDKFFKVWKLQSEKGPENMQSLFWTCETVGQFKDMVPTCARFSKDDSILAISFGHVLTLWDAQRFVLVKVLPVCSDATIHLHGVQFLNGINKHYLVAFSEYQLFVIDLLTYCTVWSYVLPVRFLSVHPYDGTFMVSTRDEIAEVTRFIHFDSRSPQPKEIVEFAPKVSAMTFVPERNGKEAMFVCLTQDFNIFKSNQQKKVDAVHVEEPSFLSSILEQTEDMSRLTVKDSGMPKVSRIMKFFEEPTAACPPISLLYEMVIKEEVKDRERALKLEDLINGVTTEMKIADNEWPQLRTPTPPKKETLEEVEAMFAALLH